MKGERDMLCETKYIYDNNDKVFLTTYISDERVPEGGRPAILIIPGGAYTHCSARESEPVAKKFLAEGYNAFVLSYTLIPDIIGENGEFVPLIDTAHAVAHIRKNCGEYSINPDRIAVIGFSAGGHLAALIGARWNDGALCEMCGEKSGDIKPNAVLLSYALTVMREQEGLEDALDAAGEKGAELYDYLSADLAVTEHMPPTFMWHTAEDDVVPVKQTLTMAQALSAAKVPFEVHVFPVGGHGLSVCDSDTVKESFASEYDSVWVRYALDWLKTVFA